MRKQSLIFIFVFALLVIPLISSYSFGSWGTGYYNSPLDLFDNEWVVFGIIFVVFFAIIFYTINKTFKNTGVSAVIGAGLALFIALTLARRGILYGYFGDEIGSWMLIIVSLIGFGFIIRFAYQSFAGLGAIIVVGVSWYLLHITGPYEVLPYEILTDAFVKIYEFTASWLGGIVLMVLTIILINLGKEEKTFAEMMFKPRKRKFNILGR